MSQTVFITGSGQGLGLALAEKFLELEFTVFAGFHHHKSRLDDLQTIYPDLKMVHCDVTDGKSVAAAVREIGHQAKKLDILINNAAVHLGGTDSKTVSKTAPKTVSKTASNLLEMLDWGEIRNMFEVNTIGPLQVTQHFLKLLEKGAIKLIVNISSEAGSIEGCRRPDEFGYSMSKAALNMESKILQNYLGEKGYKILAIHPGWMRTAMGGDNAAIDPREAAEGIARLTAKKWQADDGIFFDYTGKPMAW